LSDGLIDSKVVDWSSEVIDLVRKSCKLNAVRAAICDMQGKHVFQEKYLCFKSIVFIELIIVKILFLVN